MRRSAFLSLFFVAATAFLPVHSQTRSHDKAIRSVLQMGLENMPRLRCDGEKPCAPATAEEFRNPPISVSEARRILMRGAISGDARHCNLDWAERNFRPMMAYWRRAGKSERQMALIGFLHGVMQGTTLQSLSNSPCSAAMKAKIENELDFRL